MPGSGTNDGPSISIHAITAKGNDKPLRVIKGSKTQLNWPTGLAFDATRRELFVANDMGPSILVFDAERRRQRRPEARAEGAAHGPRAPDVGLDRCEERRALGSEFRRPLGDGVSD